MDGLFGVCAQSNLNYNKNIQGYSDTNNEQL